MARLPSSGNGTGAQRMRCRTLSVAFGFAALAKTLCPPQGIERVVRCGKTAGGTVPASGARIRRQFGRTRFGRSRPYKRHHSPSVFKTGLEFDPECAELDGQSAKRAGECPG